MLICQRCFKKKDNELQGCIDDERQFKMAKRSQAPGDATVLKRIFPITLLFFVVDRKNSILESVNISTCADMQIFNFRDGHVTTFRHLSGAYICRMSGQTLQTSKRHTFRVSAYIVTIGLG